MLLEAAVMFVHSVADNARLVSCVDRKNLASFRLHEKAGFRIDETHLGYGRSELRYRMVWGGEGPGQGREE
jgi:L-amino acid N-acyltransferase YncA